jgi:HAD superfamily hydrolase (TIGR01509 family)
MSSLPDAVAFDCDGTIADTESLSELAWSDLLRSRGLAWGAEDFQTLVGRPFAVNWAHVSTRGDLGDMEVFRQELRVRFRALFDARLEVHEDVVGVIRELARRRVPLAVVSSSSHDHIERVLDRAGITTLISHIVAAGDTVRPKPDPGPYSAACVALGVRPRRSVGVEDTPTGARSSRTAGLRTIGVRRAHAVPELDTHAHAVVDALDITHVMLQSDGQDEAAFGAFRIG